MSLESLQDQLSKIISDGNYIQVREVTESDPENSPHTYDHVHWKKIQEQPFYEFRLAIKETLLGFVFIVGTNIFIYTGMGLITFTGLQLTKLALNEEIPPTTISVYMALFFLLELGFTLSNIGGEQLIRGDNPYVRWHPDDPRNPNFKEKD